MDKSFVAHRIDIRRTARREAANAGVKAAPKVDAQPAVPRESGPREIGGPKGPEPTRFGDWERKGICVDF